ncbi:MAG: carbohydrate ABC transporter permease [Treponema sp.]|jgi:multiple sugar transport system permease protein|nr:carbohydrate ABC transporter permease [Treponema sp.]
MNPGKGRLILMRSFVQVVMLALGLIAILPVYVVLVNATRSIEQINMGLSLVPSANILNNWQVLSSTGAMRIWRGFANSAFISICATTLSIYCSAMTAYGLHAYRFKGRLFLLTVILIIIMLPGTLSFIGFYQSIVRMKLLNSYIPLILPGMAAAVTVLFLRQYMLSVLSAEMIDAARIDGAGEYRIFNIIVLPIMAPALAAQSIFSFVGSWNNFMVPFVLISDKKRYTLPMMVQTLRGNIYNSEMGGIYLGLAISLVPILIFYAFFSRFIITGISIGSIKEKVV